jgi:hypothetical protein
VPYSSPPSRNEPDALVAAADQGHLDVVRTLVAGGADLNATNTFGDTALMAAARHGYDAIVGLLLKRGANPNLEDRDGDTALGIARHHGHDKIAMLLVEHGADEGEGPTAKQLMMEALRYIQPAPLPKTHLPSAVLKDPYLELHRLSEILSHKTDGSGVFRMIVDSGRSILGADGCTLYLVRDGELHVEVLLSQSLQLTLDAAEKGGPLVEATPIWRPDGEVDETSLAAVCAATGEPINVADVRELPSFVRARSFDERLGYNTVSVLTMPVLSRGRVYAVLQFVNALDNRGQVGPFTKHHQAMAHSVATLLSLAPLLFSI